MPHTFTQHRYWPPFKLLPRYSNGTNVRLNFICFYLFVCLFDISKTCHGIDLISKRDQKKLIRTDWFYLIFEKFNNIWSFTRFFLIYLFSINFSWKKADKNLAFKIFISIKLKFSVKNLKLWFFPLILSKT